VKGEAHFKESARLHCSAQILLLSSHPQTVKLSLTCDVKDVNFPNAQERFHEEGLQLGL